MSSLKNENTKKLSKEIDQSSPLAKKCLTQVNEEEFLFYSYLAISVGQLQTPVPSPTQYGINVFDEKSDKFSNIRFTGDALNRMLVALIENMDENERNDKMPAIGTRLFALIDLLNDGKLEQWTKPYNDDDSNILIPEAVIRAAASVTIDDNLQFIWKEFQQKVEEISQSESNKKKHNG